jgi:hypothetical protein
MVAVGVLATSSGECVAKLDSDRPPRSENTTAFLDHIKEYVEIRTWRLFLPDLVVAVAIRDLLEIRRRRDDGIDAAVW